MADEGRLVERIRGGDRSAFEELYRAQYESLVYFAVALVRADEIVRDFARDIVGDVFLNVWRSRDSWTPTHGVRAYLFGAVRNRASNARRDLISERRRDLQIAGEGDLAEGEWSGEAPQQPDANLDRVELSESVWRAVDALPERARLVVQLRWREEMDFTEIASILGITRESAHVLHSRAIAALRRQFGAPQL
jgi:RNA polymerase sigma-70 factor (ECF subfamily)